MCRSIRSLPKKFQIEIFNCLKNKKDDFPVVFEYLDYLVYCWTALDPVEIYRRF